MAFHAVDENFDTGPLIKLSGKIAIPPDSSVVDMHKITSYAAAKLAADEVLKLIQSNKNIKGLILVITRNSFLLKRKMIIRKVIA